MTVNRLSLSLFLPSMQQSVPQILWILTSIRLSVKDKGSKLNKALSHLHREQSSSNFLNYSKMLSKLKSLTCLNDLMQHQQYSINLRRFQRLWHHHSFNNLNFCHIYHIKKQTSMCKKLMVVALNKLAKERVVIKLLS